MTRSRSPVASPKAASPLAPLRRRDFALLWAGSLVSNVGSWMQTVAVGALVTADTGRATWTVLVAAGAFLPIGLLSPVGGALADRLDRKRWLIIGNVVEVALAMVLAALVYAGDTGPALLTLVVTAQGCVTALILPFQSAILPDLVPRSEFLSAASLNSAQFNMGRVIGPAAAGVTVAAFGYGTAFVANAVSFLAVVIALCFIRLAPPAATSAQRLWSTIRSGARAAFAEPACRAAIVLIAVVALLASPFIALVPAVARSLTNGSKSSVAEATAALTTAQGIGAVLGALAIAPLAAAFGRGRVLVGQLAALSIALIGYALTPSLVLAAVALTVVGAIYIGVLSGLQTVVQLRAPDEFRGRILGIYLVALGVVYPVGALLQGPLADRIGLPVTTTLFATGLLVVLALTGVFRPDTLRVLGEDLPQVALTPVLEGGEAAVEAPGVTPGYQPGRRGDQNGPVPERVDEVAGGVPNAEEPR
ncbi:MAG TPA: MFS transporter [Acidimicrobiales bacterium]|nr:MFS transporter [Acidimicrobiales bacterium]